MAFNFDRQLDIEFFLKIACATVIVPPIVTVVLLGLLLYQSFESSLKGMEFFVSDVGISSCFSLILSTPLGFVALEIVLVVHDVIS